MIKLEALKIFVAVAESGSFNGAASRLGIAPPVVSRSIKNLEQRLKTSLFKRTTRKISITPDGDWLLQRARQTMENLEGIQAHFLDRQTEPEGQITLDAATPFALHIIAPVISNFLSTYPKVEISLECNEAVTDLIDKQVDVAIRVGRLKDSSLKSRKIGATRRALFASPDYLERYGTPRRPAELEDHQLLGFSGFKSLNRWPLKTAEGDWLTITPSLRSNNGEALKQLALHGNGIICVSHFAVQKEVERGELLPILEKQILEHTIPITAVFYAERAVSRHIRVFLDFLAANVGEV